MLLAKLKGLNSRKDCFFIAALHKNKGEKHKEVQREYKMKKFLTTTLVATVVAGCASHPDEIDPVYVPTAQFSGLNCAAISQEMTRISPRIIDLYTILRNERHKDSAQMGAGIAFLFWPAILLLEGGDGDEAEEFAKLRGEFSALDKVATETQCDRSQLPVNPIHKIEETMKALHEKKAAVEVGNKGKVYENDAGDY